MRTHRELIDNYHEASWALAMERVAIQQGEAAEELMNQLQDDPNAALPQHTVDRCQDTIRKAFSPFKVKRVKKAATRILIAAVLLGLMTTAACAISPQFREFISKIFYSVAETFTSMTLRDPQVEDGAGSQEQIVFSECGIQLEWLPEEYEYIEGSEESKFREVKFKNAQSDYIYIYVINHDDASVYNFDSESGTVTSVMIGDSEGWVLEEGNYRTIMWVDLQCNKVISIFSTNLTFENLLLLAQGLRY